jgi:hypothetical protein
MRLLRLLSLVAILACTLVPLEASLIRTDLTRTIDFTQTSSVGFNFIGVFFEARAFVTPITPITNVNFTYPSNVPTPGNTTDAMTAVPGENAYAFRSPLYNIGGNVANTVALLSNIYSAGNYDYHARDIGNNVVDTSIVAYNTDYFPVAFQAPVLSATSYDNLNGMDPSMAYTFSWNSFNVNPGADENLIYLSVRDTFGNVVWSANNPLAANVTSVILPSGTLATNTAYFWDLYFSSRINSSVVEPAAAFPWTQQFNTHTFGAFTTGDINNGPPQLPEPSTYGMFLGGIAVLGLARRRSLR